MAKRVTELQEANQIEATDKLMLAKTAADYGVDVTKFLVWNTDTGAITPVKIGANGTGPGGTGRALYVDNV